ncbi:pirin family protein [Pseudaeromonas paramecii]|uniref:Pirin family protein n=1 Tax=Pseudaeromonas paramecii TaxID=2138166 RepID=A0ABP8Q666_9GAMM
MSQLRTLTRLLTGQPTQDGAGVKLVRVIGTQRLPDLDPFLMLDEFSSDEPQDYLAGFPEHPHRGFETVTYMLAGRMRHRDNQGFEGVLESGDVQWMTAGSGLIHSEMPEQEGGLMRGFQLWINLPRAEKMKRPHYQDIAAARIPEVSGADGSRVRVIAGEFAGARGPVEGVSLAPLYLDLSLPAGSRLTVPVTLGQTALLFGVEGQLEVADTSLAKGQLGVLSDGDTVQLAGGEQGGRALLLAARPLKEPVARYGPFVMNTQQEIVQAIEDYQAGRF